MIFTKLTPEQKAAFLKNPTGCPYCGKHASEGPEEHLTEPDFEEVGDWINPKISFDCNCCRREFAVQYKIELVEDGVNSCFDCGAAIKDGEEASWDGRECAFRHPLCRDVSDKRTVALNMPQIAETEFTGHPSWWNCVDAVLDALPPNPPAEIVDVLEEAYMRVGHEGRCARTFSNAAECTCGRSRLAARLNDLGRQV